MHKASYYKNLKKDAVQCQLCPHYCTLKPGEYGTCRARKNIDGQLYARGYGKAVSTHVDPIEKKPLFHFLPGERAFSFGTAGCNLNCDSCQNWRISQSGPDELEAHELTPKQIVEQAENAGCKIIAYTYTEPTIFYEYMVETAKIAKQRGIKNVIVTNGFINHEPLHKLLNYIDAANVDLKSIREDFYKDYCAGRLKPVLRTIKNLARSKVWLEITNLIVPRLNSSELQIKELVREVKSIGSDAIPIHFSAFFPCYKLSERKPTSPDKLTLARKLALDEGMKYVYTGNVLDLDGSTTYCPKCSAPLIKRFGYTTENSLEGGKCPDCGEKIEGVWK